MVWKETEVIVPPERSGCGQVLVRAPPRRHLLSPASSAHNGRVACPPCSLAPSRCSQHHPTPPLHYLKSSGCWLVGPCTPEGTGPVCWLWALPGTQSLPGRREGLQEMSCPTHWLGSHVFHGMGILPGWCPSRVPFSQHMVVPQLMLKQSVGLMGRWISWAI